MPLSASTLYSSLVSSFEKSWAKAMRGREQDGRDRSGQKIKRSKKTERKDRINIRINRFIWLKSVGRLQMLPPGAFSAFAKRPNWEQWCHSIQATLSHAAEQMLLTTAWMVVNTATKHTRINRKKNTILNLGSWLEQIRTALEQLQHLEHGILILIQSNK